LQEKEIQAIQKNVDEEWDVLMGKMKSRGPKRQGLERRKVKGAVKG
jgi:hypothetical protein